jgi:hypothetical protein
MEVAIGNHGELLVKWHLAYSIKVDKLLNLSLIVLLMLNTALVGCNISLKLAVKSVLV